LAIVGLLISIIWISTERQRVEVSRSFKLVLFGVLGLLIVQILLGTQVREQIDEIAKTTPNRSLWIDLLDAKILVHRSFSVLIFISSAWLFWRNYKMDYSFWSLGALIVFVILEIVAGAVMYYFNVPKVLQPVHLLLSVGMFAFVFWAVLRSKILKQKAAVKIESD
jgi:cytochrome c oxidase assembly protein subunit 15